MPHPIVFYPRGLPVVVSVSVAVTPDARALGLRGFEFLAPDTGMLFVWPRDVRTDFTTAQTPMPLDLIYLRYDDIVLDIVTMHAMDPRPYQARQAYRAALEVSAGWAARHDVTPGTPYAIPAWIWNAAV